MILSFWGPGDTWQVRSVSSHGSVIGRICLKISLPTGSDTLKPSMNEWFIWSLIYRCTIKHTKNSTISVENMFFPVLSCFEVQRTYSNLFFVWCLIYIHTVYMYWKYVYYNVVECSLRPQTVFFHLFQAPLSKNKSWEIRPYEGVIKFINHHCPFIIP